jgi:hypothetical protein
VTAGRLPDSRFSFTDSRFSFISCQAVRRVSGRAPGNSSATGLTSVDNARLAALGQDHWNVTVPGLLVLSHTGAVEQVADFGGSALVGSQGQPPAGRLGWARRPRIEGPSDRALRWLAGWYVIALRLGGAVLFTAVAVLAATGPISPAWLAPALVALCLWSVFFGWHVRRFGLTPGVVLVDACVISALALFQRHLVPSALIMDDTSWMLPLACTSIYILQLALRPRLALPGAAVVVVAYGVGTGDPTGGWLLVAETLVAAGLVAVMRGGAWQADAFVAARSGCCGPRRRGGRTSASSTASSTTPCCPP